MGVYNGESIVNAHTDRTQVSLLRNETVEEIYIKS